MPVEARGKIPSQVKLIPAFRVAVLLLTGLVVGCSAFLQTQSPVAGFLLGLASVATGFWFFRMKGRKNRDLIRSFSVNFSSWSEDDPLANNSMYENGWQRGYGAIDDKRQLFLIKQTNDGLGILFFGDARRGPVHLPWHSIEKVTFVLTESKGIHHAVLRCPGSRHSLSIADPSDELASALRQLPHFHVRS